MVVEILFIQCIVEYISQPFHILKTTLVLEGFGFVFRKCEEKTPNQCCANRSLLLYRQNSIKLFKSNSAITKKNYSGISRKLCLIT